MNQFLQDFIKRTNQNAMKEPAPNPSAKTKLGKPKDTRPVDASFAEIIEEKPSAKKVLEYLKGRINTIYEDKE